MHKDYDQLLSIETGNFNHAAEMPTIQDHRPYEATPYSILYSLFTAYPLQAVDKFVDFGSGKGRLLFYVHYLFGSSVTGIEVNEVLYKKSLINKKEYSKHKEIKNETLMIKYCSAEDYEVEAAENIFYFFNPFSLQIFKKVLQNILDSVLQFPREIDIILYYPNHSYLKYIEEKTPFHLLKEVQIPILYPLNNDERFLIYRY